MNQPTPTEAPSRMSVIAMGALTAVVYLVAFAALYSDDGLTFAQVAGFFLGIGWGGTLLIQTFDRGRRRMVALERTRREERAAERQAQIREANTGRWVAPEDPEHVVLELWWDEGTWRATGPFLMDYDGPRDPQNWITLPSDAYVKVMVTDAEGAGFTPVDDLATRQMRAHLGLVWAEPDDAVDSD
jgi:hypothetical protein